jgi:crotonobetainyl-CoA hydratase
VDVTAPPLLVETVGAVAVLTLNRPASLNAIDTALGDLLGDTLARLDADPAVGACVLTGAGRAFCAGMDLTEFAAGRPLDAARRPERGFAGFVRHRLDLPVIAAVNGVAVGGGAEIVLACDAAVASYGATFAFPEVRRGLVPGAGGVLRLAQQIPPKRAAELLLTGASFTAAEAATWGLVNRVVPAGETLASAIELASAIAGNAPLAVRAVLRLLRDCAQESSWTDAPWDRNRAELERLFPSADAHEGARAFLERRAPRWTGR